jgi:acetolactate synthase-1/2/3 large subunit
MKVYEAIANALIAEATEHVFGLIGDANMALWSVLRQQLTIVSARNDSGAVLMADGYAQATGRLGIATVTAGPGIASCGSAMVSAARAQTPMIIFTGEYSAGSHNVQAFDHRRFAAACESHFQPLALESLAEDILEGFYAARTRRCPVVLNLPSALWEADYAWEWSYRPSTQFITGISPAPQPDDLDALVQRLVEAQRPVIIAGRGAAVAGVRELLEALADRVGALLGTSLLAKGFFDGHPYDIGICGSFSSAPSERLLADADFVLGVGASLNYYTTEGGMLFPSAEVARIDSNPAPRAVGVLPGLYLHGDARKSVNALLTALDRRGTKNEGFRTAETRSILQAPAPPLQSPDDGLDPRKLMRELARVLPDRTQIVSGGGHFIGWPVLHLALPPGGRYQHTIAFGSIGLAMAHGIGAAVGNPDRTTIVIEGDGSLMQGIAELHIAAERKLPLIVLVLNDGGYGAEVHKLAMKGFGVEDAAWRSPDFVAIARGFGCDGVRLAKEDELGPAILNALNAKGPHLIDARVSPSLLSDVYLKLYRGQANTAPLLRPMR